MRTWTTTTTVGADADAVLDVLTDPEACRRWAPVSFDVSGLPDDRLLTGSRARPAPPAKPVVGGRLAGRSVGFDVQSAGVLDTAVSRLGREAVATC